MMTDDSTTTLQHWLDRHRAGDPAARNELMGHSRERLRLLTCKALRRYPGVRDLEGTSDVLQNVLIRLDRALSAVEIGSVRDFLRLAASHIRNELIDLKRHYFGVNGQGANQKVCAPIGEQMVAQRTADDADGPFQLALWTEFHRQIAGLDEEDRELFEHVYYQGLSQPAAAELMGVPLTTFKRRWQAARLRLAVRLRDGMPE
jgi:RNA polymerase sigma factor (sigma-70 family)